MHWSRGENHQQVAVNNLLCEALWVGCGFFYNTVALTRQKCNKTSHKKGKIGRIPSGMLSLSTEIFSINLIRSRLSAYPILFFNNNILINNLKCSNQILMEIKQNSASFNFVEKWLLMLIKKWLWYFFVGIFSEFLNSDRMPFISFVFEYLTFKDKHKMHIERWWYHAHTLKFKFTPNFYWLKRDLLVYLKFNFN